MAVEQSLRIDDENPTVFVLKRELSEVHLLLDNLSTNPLRSLASADTDRPERLAPDWIERICLMNWPPDNRTPEQRGGDAALLVRAKDYLNTLTAPANGASIAFTVLVTQDENGGARSVWSSFARLFRARPRSRAGGGDGAGGDPPVAPLGGASPGGPTRRGLAEDAYPGLIHTTIVYRNRVLAFAMFLFAMLIITSAASFYTAFGNITLAARAAAQSRLDDATKRVSDLEGGNKTGNDGSGAGTQQTFVQVKVEHLCPPDEAKPPYNYVSIAAMQACEAMATTQRRVTKADDILGRWLQPLKLLRLDKDGDDVELVSATLVTILGTTLLPVLYGVLGAASAVVRGLSFKIKTSQLTPRDIQLLYQQLLLGTVTGSCISLFVAQPSVDHSSPGLIGTVALSASALSFVAGFGVDQVYSALETLIRRVFLVGETK